MKISNHGFTIIEAVVAVAVFAMTVSSILGVYISVQRLNRQSASLQALQQNARFLSEDIAKLVRNGQIDYGRYGTTVPQPSTANLYLLDRDGVPVWIYKSGNYLVIDKSGFGSANFTGKEVKVLDFRVYVWPSVNPFPGGSEQPSVTIFLDLQANVSAQDVTRFPFQITAATRQYPE
ncbi:MAG: hypothetical protein HY396_01960 [Candidatus Doudnabacteria bacterium]|nr:hypothetical protein [Candidatus Doudnabacteria bacterium]